MSVRIEVLHGLSRAKDASRMLTSMRATKRAFTPQATGMSSTGTPRSFCFLLTTIPSRTRTALPRWNPTTRLHRCPRLRRPCEATHNRTYLCYRVGFLWTRVGSGRGLPQLPVSLRDRRNSFRHWDELPTTITRICLPSHTSAPLAKEHCIAIYSARDYSLSRTLLSTGTP